MASADTTNMPVKKKSQMPSLLPQRLILRYLLFFAAVTFIGLAVVSIPSVADTLALATTQTPDRFTELYFIDHTKLPKSIVTGKPSSFTFNITNHEAQTTTYRARISLKDNHSQTIVQETNLTLVNGQGKNITVPFTVLADNADVELIVELLDQNMNIHFRSHS